MKIISIFSKNIKTVSRNWRYFFVLFICPIILILASGFMLSSTDVKNMKVGVINEDPNYNLNIENVLLWSNYQSLSDCIGALTNNEVVVCIHTKESNDSHDINIYIDNSFRIIEYYTKQFILDKVVQQQSSALEKTSDEINSKITLYSSSLSDAKKELLDVKKELKDQENSLLDYKKNLTEARNNFNQFYYQIKALQPQINDIRNNMLKNQENL